MRVPTMLAGVALAAVTVLWSAPVAFAADTQLSAAHGVGTSVVASDNGPGDGFSRDDDNGRHGGGPGQHHGDNSDAPAFRGGHSPGGDSVPADGNGLGGALNRVVGGVDRTLGNVDRTLGNTVKDLVGGNNDHNGRDGRDGHDNGGLLNLNGRDGLLNGVLGGNNGGGLLNLGGGYNSDGRFNDCNRDHHARSDNNRDEWFRDCNKRDRDHACGCDSDRDRDWFRDCDRDHHWENDRDHDRWYRDCDKHHRDRSCGCDSDKHRHDHDGDDDKDKKKDKNDKDTKGGKETSVYPKGAPETGGGPVDDPDPIAMLALGLTGLTGAGLAGAGAIVERRQARR